MGFLGILEDKVLVHVPATVILDDQSAQTEEVTSQLKHGTGESSHIVLVPQPSEDPNDPLNWSMSKKLTAVMIIGFGACIFASTLGPLLNAGLFVIAAEFDRPLSSITIISGYQLLVAGASGPFVSACSRKWGKRPVFIISSLFGFVGSIVGSATSNYNGLLAARIIQGGSTAAYESLVISMIGDIYFVHQRGLFMSITQFILGAVSNLSSVITGPITTNLGWKYLFHLSVLFTGLQTVLLFFFVPETQYNRDHRYDIDELVKEDLKELGEVERRHREQIEDAGLEKSPTVISTRSEHRARTKKTFRQELAVFTGTYCTDNFLQLLIAPLAVCSNIAVLWVVVVSGTLVATYVATAYVLAQIFSPPPYLLTASGVGYLSIGPTVGGIIGALFLGSITDPVIKWCARKNRGVYEPEYRLVAMIPAVFTGMGLMLFGYLCQNYASYYATATVHGLTLFGIVAATIGTSGYALDAYREMSSEVFVAGIIFKNFLFYGFSYFVNDWTATAGPAHVFYVFGGVAFALIATTPVVFVFGKRYRSFWSRHNIMEKFHIRTHADF